MFSSRVPASLALNRLATALAAHRRAGQPLIDLTESNPTRVGLDYPTDLLAPLAACQGLVYEPHPMGLQSAREAIAADYARRAVAVDPARVAVTASTSEAYSMLFKVLADPGDDVLVPRPSYPLFDLLTALDGVVARPYDLEYHGAWSINMASVERALGPQTRAVLVVNPNNPTGSFISRQEHRQLAELCAVRGIALIADEVFADYALEPPDGDRASVLNGSDALTFGLGGLSKSVGLPQVKLGWMAVTGPDALVLEACERLEIACDSYLSVSTPVQLALPALLGRGAAIREQIVARVAANYRHLRLAVAAAPSCRVLPAAGGWSAVVQVPTFRPEEELVLTLLTADGVLAHPGYFFDFPRESFLVVSLLPPAAAFAVGIERLIERATTP